MYNVVDVELFVLLVLVLGEPLPDSKILRRVFISFEQDDLFKLDKHSLLPTQYLLNHPLHKCQGFSLETVGRLGRGEFKTSKLVYLSVV
jgi:hypothetical protein